MQQKISPIVVGITYNLKRILPDALGNQDTEAEFDAESTVESIKKALEGLGYKVVKLEATANLPSLLHTHRIDVVFNIAEGIKGRTRESQVPALLDLLGIEYTGSDATTMSITLDKSLAKQIVSQAGILTPRSIQLISGKEKLPLHLKFPLILKPIAEGSSKGIFNDNVVFTEEQLRHKSTYFLSKYKQPILAEEYIKGREFTVGILGQKKLRVLPPMEIVFLNKENPYPVYSFEYKLDFKDNVRYDAPAQLTHSEYNAIEKMAKMAFQALGCRDVARIDIRISEKGEIYFLECNPIPGLAENWSDICLMATGAGMSYQNLIREIISPALRRYKERYREVKSVSVGL